MPGRLQFNIRSAEVGKSRALRARRHLARSRSEGRRIVCHHRRARNSPPPRAPEPVPKPLRSAAKPRAPGLHQKPQHVALQLPVSRPTPVAGEPAILPRLVATRGRSRQGQGRAAAARHRALKPDPGRGPPPEPLAPAPPFPAGRRPALRVSTCGPSASPTARLEAAYALASRPPISGARPDPWPCVLPPWFSRCDTHGPGSAAAAPRPPCGGQCPR